MLPDLGMNIIVLIFQVYKSIWWISQLYFQMLKVELLLICGVKAAFRILIIGYIRVPCRKNHIYRVTHFRENYSMLIENLQNAMSYFRRYSNLNDVIFWSCFGGFYATKKEQKKYKTKKRQRDRSLDV